jgi:glutamate racemase
MAAVSPVFDSPDLHENVGRERLRPIGVFDSGVGGLTVVSALRRLLPAENIFYLGDTARVPYGGKSAATIERYSLEICGLLLAEGAKAIVVACNTASALAVPRLQETLRVPVIGVIGPGASAAAEATKTGRVGIIGTRATVASGAYERALHKLAPQLRVTAQACPLLVPLIEEGLLEDHLTEQHILRYLQPLLVAGIDTLILGCTHYPLLSPALARLAGPGIRLVDSAHTCALAVQSLLRDSDLQAPDDHAGTLRVALTDASDSFLRVAERALGLNVGDVELRSVQGVAGSATMR